MRVGIFYNVICHHAFALLGLIWTNLSFLTVVDWHLFLTVVYCLTTFLIDEEELLPQNVEVDIFFLLCFLLVFFRTFLRSEFPSSFANSLICCIWFKLFVSFSSSVKILLFLFDPCRPHHVVKIQREERVGTNSWSFW